MSHDPEDDASAFGSLTEMFPHLATAPEPIPLAPVHVRALAFEDGPELTLGFVVWSDPGGVARLRRDLGHRIEGAFLALLSRSASTIRDEGERRPSRVRVLFFAHIASGASGASGAGDVASALAPFGLARVPYDAKRLAPTMSLVRGEAARCGASVPEEPTEVWEVEVRLPDGARGVELERIELMMRDNLGDTVWGENPGEFFRMFSAALVSAKQPPLGLDLEAIDRLETIVGQLIPGRIRFIPPLAFQALADAIGVVATKEFARRIDWALCEADDDGLAPPPLLRAKLPDGIAHIPIGEHLLRWSMMPLAVGEVPPALSEWVLDQFGDRTKTK